MDKAQAECHFGLILSNTLPSHLCLDTAQAAHSSRFSTSGNHEPQSLFGDTYFDSTVIACG